MPIFHLRPVPALLDDEVWRNSPYRGALWVNAGDEAEARALASGRYDDASASIPGGSDALSPWRDARLVAAAIVPAGPAGAPIPEGVVLGDRQM